MFDPFQCPGLRYVGEHSHPQVNHGQPLPVFEPAAPKNRPNINTLEGWNALAYSRTADHLFLQMAENLKAKKN